ncbi:hypothetical protein AB0B31_14785 [Catellatospora citrea]|uniref:effector-associated constant component EACC1 n=1 Tax=Catellatospora citrea TaxID=53366 RepID=UPI0033F0F768
MRIAVDGSRADATALWDWLRAEPGLRGRVQLVDGPAEPGTMGHGTLELVVVLAATVVGPLSIALRTWLVQRTTKATVKVPGPAGPIEVTLIGTQVTEELLRDLIAGVLPVLPTSPDRAVAAEER